mmetsp:Transcript_3966/g.9279  ORF Transcript_3966/g.9279 Transcript_3966/m.9279 type:complete len:325 (-) Transcript_3966:1265-2239(-)
MRLYLHHNLVVREDLLLCACLLDPHHHLAVVRDAEALHGVSRSRLCLPVDGAFRALRTEHPFVLGDGGTLLQPNPIVVGVAVGSAALLSLAACMHCCHVLGVLDWKVCGITRLGRSKLGRATVLGIAGKEANRCSASQQLPAFHHAQIIGTRFLKLQRLQRFARICTGTTLNNDHGRVRIALANVRRGSWLCRRTRGHLRGRLRSHRLWRWLCPCLHSHCRCAGRRGCANRCAPNLALHWAVRKVPVRKWSATAGPRAIETPIVARISPHDWARNRVRATSHATCQGWRRLRTVPLLGGPRQVSSTPNVDQSHCAKEDQHDATD